MIDTAVAAPPNRPSTGTWQRTGSAALLWTFLFVVCMGLGSPSVSRYDPGTTGNADAIQYSAIVRGSPYDAIRHWRFRVLTPYVAKPFYILLEGRAGRWDAAATAMLIANSLFTATAALLLVGAALRMTGSVPVSLMAALVLLLNWVVAQEHLAGLVDASELFCVMLLTRLLMSRTWWALALVGVIGMLAKETFAAIGLAYAGGWWLANLRRESRAESIRLFGGIVAMSVGAAIAAGLLRFVILGSSVGPAEIVERAAAGTPLLMNTWNSVRAPAMVYTLVWLLPMGLAGLWLERRGIDPAWVVASMLAVTTAFLLGVYAGSGGNTARPIFSSAGPLLSIGVALLLVRLVPSSFGNGRGTVGG